MPNTSKEYFNLIELGFSTFNDFDYVTCLAILNNQFQPVCLLLLNLHYDKVPILEFF